MIEGVLALVAFLILGSLIAWVPIAALAGILIVVGVRMFDRHSLSLLRSRSTVLDFMVIVTVIVVAETVSLIAASGVGIALAILLFLREQIGGAVVRRKSYGNERFSKQMRLPEEMAVLEKRGERTAIFELQGSLFFGTTDQLYTALEAELKKRDYIVLDMRRVQSVDLTAAHMLELVEDMMSERSGSVIFSHMPSKAPSGQDMREYFAQMGLVRQERHAKIFAHLDEALEWIEDRVLAAAHLERAQEMPLDIRHMDMFRQREEETLAALEAGTELRTFQAGQKIFSHGDSSDELFFIRKGSVRIVMPLEGRTGHHLATFGAGRFLRRTGVHGPGAAVGRCGRRHRCRTVRADPGALRRAQLGASHAGAQSAGRDCHRDRVAPAAHRHGIAVSERVVAQWLGAGLLRLTCLPCLSFPSTNWPSIGSPSSGSPRLASASTNAAIARWDPGSRFRYARRPAKLASRLRSFPLRRIAMLYGTSSPAKIRVTH